MINKNLHCSMPCADVNKDILFPKIDINPGLIKMVMVSEATPMDHADYFDHENGSFFSTTKSAFQDAGVMINSYNELTKSGVYLTTAIKCSKKDYLVSSATIKECSKLLRAEIEQFTNLKVIMCMGDFAIKAVNAVYKEKFKVSPIKSGSTYKIRNEEYFFNNIRFFPSYTQTGDSFNLEKSKRKMIAEDIKKALDYIEMN